MNYETLLGELGNNLSSGQKQQLFVAHRQSTIQSADRIIALNES
ncbi:hypothetical protein [Ursidibacter arcticus]|nr:hypothetical protein [Ursidibacter arcticus]